MRGQVREFRHKTFLKSVTLENFLGLLKHLGFPDDHGLVMAIQSADKKLILEHYEGMIGSEREKLEQTLLLINDFNSDDGMVHLVCTSDQIGLEHQDLTALDLAIRLWVHDRFHFDRAHRMLRLNFSKGYTEFVAKDPVACDSVSDASLEQMKSLFSEHLRAQEFGRKVFIEQQNYSDRLVITIWKEHYTKVLATLNEESQLQPVQIRPVYDSTLIYYPDEGRLKVKAQTDDLVTLARQAFANICLECPNIFEHEDAKIILDLERLKRMKSFPVDVVSGIQSVRITGIKGKIHADTSDSIELRFYNSSLEEALDSRSLGLQDITLQKVWIAFKLRLKNNSQKSKTVTLSAPHTTNLVDTEYDRVIEQKLKEWGIITGVQHVLQLA